MYTQIIIKFFLKKNLKHFHDYTKKKIFHKYHIFCCLLYIRMIDLSLNELKLIAKSRNIKDYKSKSKKDLIKALSETKPKIRINKKKLEDIRKGFNELKYKFSKKEVDKYRKAFYDIKNYRHLSASEIMKVGKNPNELKKV